MISKEILGKFAKEYHEVIEYCGGARLSNEREGILCIHRHGKIYELPKEWEHDGKKYAIEVKFALSNSEEAKERQNKKRNALSSTSNDVARRKKVRPLVGGISIDSMKAAVGANDDGTGTLGLIVRSMNKGRGGIDVGDVILSCDHVIADSSLFQPGTFDNGGEIGDRISEWTTGAKHKFNSINDDAKDGMHIDAAIAKPDESIGVDAYKIFLKSGETIPLKGMCTYENVKIGTIVSKAGRATGITSGTVVSKAFFEVNKMDGELETGAILVESEAFMSIVDFAVPSDSGSIVWQKATKQVVGLLWGATLYRKHLLDDRVRSMAFVTPIELICKKFNLTMSPEPVKATQIR